MDKINKTIKEMIKKYGTPESKIKTSKDIIQKTKELRQWVDAGFKHIDTKEETDIPFLTLKELEQLILDDRNAEIDKILLRK